MLKSGPDWKEGQKSKDVDEIRRLIFRWKEIRVVLRMEVCW